MGNEFLLCGRCRFPPQWATGEGGYFPGNIRCVDYHGLSPPGGMCSEIGGCNFRTSVNLNDTCLYLVKLNANTSMATVRVWGEEGVRECALFLANLLLYPFRVNSTGLNFRNGANV